MLRRPQRLRAAADIKEIVRTGTMVRTPYITIWHRPGVGQQSRTACVAGKKVHLQAVKRHRYQRWLRVLAAEVMAQLPQPVDMVWVAQSRITQVDSLDQVRQSIASLTDGLAGRYAKR